MRSHGIRGNAIHGTYDENDFGNVLVGNTLTATDNGVGADVYGRGSINGFTDPNNDDAPISLVYYVVGPEVLRIIDVDFNDALVGSAYGQGSATSFGSTVLSTDVFGILDNTEDAYFAAAGHATGLASPPKYVAIQSGKTPKPSKKESGAGCKSPHSLIPGGQGENFSLDILFHRMSVTKISRQLRNAGVGPALLPAA